MKFIFYVVIIAASGWAGWFFYPSIHEGMQARIDERKKEKEKTLAAARTQAIQDMRVTPSGTSPAIAMLEAIKGKQPAPANGSASPNPNNLRPGDPANTKPVEPSKAVVVDEIEARYPMPNFKTIEEITKEWTTIPSRAFPKKIKSKVPLTFEGATGKLELPSGSDIIAAGMRPNSGILIVMREGDDTTRVDVPLANTDMKEFLTNLYEKYKNHRKRVLAQRDRARGLKDHPSGGGSEEQIKLAGPKPEVRAGGVIPIMLASIDELKLKELKASAITSWGGLNFEEVEGKVYWTGTVQCTVENPLFGPTQTEVMALIKDNKVEKWLFTGSREEVQ